MIAKSTPFAEQSLLWHQRLTHINCQDLSKIPDHVDGVPKLQPLVDTCRACELGKAHKLPFKRHFH